MRLIARNFATLTRAGCKPPFYEIELSFAMNHHKGFRLITRHSIKLLSAMMMRFSNSSSGITFIGDLSHFDNRVLTPFGIVPTPINLISNTYQITLPLDSASVSMLTRFILPRVGLRKRIYEVKIDSYSQLEFIAADCFHEDTVWVSHNVSELFLHSLVEDKVLSSFQAIK